MASEEKNQSNIINSELNLNYNKYIYADEPINRFKTKPKVEDVSIKLDELRNEIEKIEDCELKKNTSKIVFSDGNNRSKIMIVGEGPGQKEDQEGRPFVGDAGLLLNKLLSFENYDTYNFVILKTLEAYNHLFLYKKNNWEKNFSFVREVGINFINIAREIILKKHKKKWTKKEKEIQFIKRGRYIEFNLLYDKGTKFGLQTGGNVEAILMSLPPLAKWK